MAEQDIELFEAIAGNLLSELGYERNVMAISPQIGAVAEQCRKWWEGNMAQRRAKAKARSGTKEDAYARTC